MFTPRIYTVESVTSGHPDKVCDQISDTILDACLSQDPTSRVAVETFGGHGLILVCGEVTTTAKVDYEAIARQVYRDIGYVGQPHVVVNVVEQSPDIAMGVDTGGAGDQGIMYGFATDETSQRLPRGVVIAHALTAQLERVRRAGALPWLRPDGKAQVTIEDGRVTKVLVSTQHAPDLSQEVVRRGVVEQVILPNLHETERDAEILVNPTGSFVLGGFDADTGLTGRKIMVDTYGGFIPHGGGAFSGKDPTKVDRSAAYMARFVAKNIVSRGLARQCLVSVSYAIGRAEPMMVEALNERGESVASLTAEFDFRPRAIIDRLQLRRPIYRQTAAYGHFGKEGLPWEEVVAQTIPVYQNRAY